MDEILASIPMSGESFVHIATLSRKTIEESEAGHLGFSGYFLFETVECSIGPNINILAKTPSLEAAFRLADIWTGMAKAAV